MGELTCETKVCRNLSKNWRDGFIVANRPGTPRTVPDLEALSRITKFTWIVPDFQGSSDRSGLSSFMEGHLALASVEQ